MYNWQYKNWPQFEFDLAPMVGPLMNFMLKAGELSGMLSALPENMSTETIIEIMVSEASKTSEIEGEIINRNDVMSSIRKNLGLNIDQEPKDKNAIGLSKMLIDVRNSYKEELTENKILEWHSLLMSNNKYIHAGQWRTHSEPMQVVSGSISNPKIHFEAPPSKVVPFEMERFVEWFNNSGFDFPTVKAAIAHLYFESIHPFEDGNGRIGRAISEKALSQGLNTPIPFSISKAIEARRKEYYMELQKAQGTLSINDWIQWFTTTSLEAVENADKMIRFTIKKSSFFKMYDEVLNERQKKVISRMLEDGPDSFQGGMNAKKYMSLTGASKPTATRDLQMLLKMNIFSIIGGGRSTRYDINM